MSLLASQHFANLHRIRFPLHSIFFQNNNFFMANKVDTGRRAIILQLFDTLTPMCIEDSPKSIVPCNFNTFLITQTFQVSELYIREGKKYVCEHSDGLIISAAACQW